jgi:hypothetical protein
MRISNSAVREATSWLEILFCGLLFWYRKTGLCTIVPHVSSSVCPTWWILGYLKEFLEWHQSERSTLVCYPTVVHSNSLPLAVLQSKLVITSFVSLWTSAVLAEKYNVTVYRWELIGSTDYYYYYYYYCLLTAIELSLGGSSPYTNKDKTNRNKYT